jgi:hypothetical protein
LAEYEQLLREVRDHPEQRLRGLTGFKKSE